MSEMNYLSILMESLKKKSEVLEAILSQNERQSAILDGERFDNDAFDETIAEKEKLIEQLKLLDSGFEKVYTRVREEILQNKEKYREEIRVIQGMIEKVTDQSTRIQVGEQRNDRKLKTRLTTERRQMKQTRSSARAVSSYYSGLSQAASAQAMFLDSRK